MSDTVTPEDAFAALGSDHRVEILSVLAAADREEEGPLAFKALFRRVDLESTSQLSYHLEKLAGVFVAKSTDGYSLTHAGDRVVRAVLSGTYTDRPSFERTILEDPCPQCDSSTLVAE